MTNRKKRPVPERHIRVRAIRRDPPDIRKLAKAVIALAMAQAEADAQAEHQAGSNQPPAEPTP